MIGSQVQLWELEKNVDDIIQSEKLEFQIQTKEELNTNLIYFRTCMKFELDRRISDCGSSYITSLLEKKVCLLYLFLLNRPEFMMR